MGLQASPGADRPPATASPISIQRLATPSSPRSPLAEGAFPRSPRSTGASAGTPYQPSSSLGHSPLPITSNFARRRLSHSQASPSSFGSNLVGSYETSLLAGRLSTVPSKPLPFLASIGVLGAAGSAAKLKCPPHLHLAFDAFFFPDSGGGSPPYVGTIDIEAHYLRFVAGWRTGVEPPTPDGRLPTFPGFQLPRKGQLQLVIRNPHSTAIKLFLIPYDLSDLRPGYRTFLRQKSYAIASKGEGGKGRLRYAVHLLFCCPPLPVRAHLDVASPGFKTKAKPKPATPKFYLHKSVRVVFASHTLDSIEKLKVVSEGGTTLDETESLFTPYDGPGVEWQTARSQAKERARGAPLDTIVVEHDQVHTGVLLTTPPPSPRHVPRPILTSDISLSSLSHTLSSFSYLPLSSVTSSPRPPSSTALDFRRHEDRGLSPIKSRSALSSSRPPSRAGDSMAIDQESEEEDEAGPEEGDREGRSSFRGR